MSQLIRSRKVVTTAPCSIPSPPTSAITAPVPASSAALLVSARRGQRHPHTPDMTSASTTDASGSQQGFGKCSNFREGSAKILTNYNFNNINDNMLAYINRFFAGWYKHLMIHRSLLRRVTRRSLRTRKKIGCGSAVIFRSPAIWVVQNSRRSMSLQTFMLNPGMSWPSPFKLSSGGCIVGGWGMPGGGNLGPFHPRS
ncbi:hypothetical protein D8674_026310 [Pyrus ussuriensis x Pyrus communis]|uniref:Uncharacterized protein n=1 Tax=Pyrus ussuriensis x Pyrus communis TaxID=2448454 RepID=A0A5N5I6K3_9ROSA|nr:hypothetical protein D8674_026310 [Pyrus ussuriensis x Pyrus communis]